MREIRQIPSGSSLPDTQWQPPYYDAAPPPDPSQEDTWDVVRKIWRRKWLVMGITFGFIVAGAGTAMVMTPRYSAEVRVLIGLPDPNVANIEAVLRTILPNSETTQSEAYVISSREVARKVAYRLALDKSPEFNPALQPKEGWWHAVSPSRLLKELVALIAPKRNDSAAVPTADSAPMTEEQRLEEHIEAALLNRIEVTPLNRSHVLGISAESQEPVTAARIANTFADVYIEQQLMRKQRATDRANAWLQTRIGELQQTAHESDRAVEQYRRENGLYETKSDTVIAQQMGTLNADLVAAENAKADAQVRLAQATPRLNNPGDVDSLPSVLQSPLIATLRGQQAELERQAAELSSTYTSKHPKVRDIRAQIKDNTSKIKEEIERIVRGLRHEAKMADDRYTRITARMEQLKRQMGQSNDMTVKLRELEREAQANRTMLQTLMQRSKETVDQREIQTSNAEIISYATVPRNPSFPPVTLILVMATLVGAGTGILLALLLENLDRTFRTAEEVEEYTGLPSLALVPIVRGRSKAPGHVVKKPYSTFTGSLRMLNARLSLANENSAAPGGVMMFTSALPGEGKTRISSSFAQLMATEGQRVILLDLDWKRPNLHRMFNQPPGAGLADLLNGDITPEQAVYHDPASGAHVMFAGNVGRFPGYVAWIERLRMLLYTLSRHYDLIVLDTSPALLAPEVLHLARLVDRTVLVVKWASTPRRAVSSEIRNLYSVGGRIAGVVLSQVNPRRYRKYGYDDAGYLNPRHLVHTAG
ncbi:GumC family protein [Shumkonia mesophila]|uniref:GumC family protein n=1 Tax=Shumkonia mesophila TaxID=2838854 RepID=UPI002934C228|nr:Wzz/FepE/Etk N-terminal domain-containing protein [Shumkonia mesophila]